METDTAQDSPDTTQQAETSTDGAASSSQTNSTPSHAPTKTLPTTRAKMASQLAYLRAFAAASNSSRRVVQVPDVANVAYVHASTISACNAFFIDCGFVEKIGRGYKPAEALFDFHRAWSWDTNTAAHKLAPIVKRAWFWDALAGRLSFKSLREEEAISVLADAASAGPEYRPQLEMLLDLLEAVGLVKRGDGVISEVKQPHGPPRETETPATDKSQQEQHSEERKETQAEAPSNSMSLSMSISVPMDELSKWSDPKKVQDFFATWAKLVNAKTEIEGMLKGKFPEETQHVEGGDTGAA